MIRQLRNALFNQSSSEGIAPEAMTLLPADWEFPNNDPSQLLASSNLFAAFDPLATYSASGDTTDPLDVPAPGSGEGGPIDILNGSGVGTPGPVIIPSTASGLEPTIVSDPPPRDPDNPFPDILEPVDPDPVDPDPVDPGPSGGSGPASMKAALLAGDTSDAPAPQTKEELRALAGTLPAAAADFDWLYRLLSTPVASSSLYLSTPAEQDIGTLAVPSALL